MPNEKSLENLKRGKKFASGDAATKKAGSNGGKATARNIAARKAFKDALATVADEILSGAQVDKLKKRGLDVDGKTLMELGAMSTIMQWIMGDMDAGKLTMEISGNDDAAERRKIERERLALEREKLAKEDKRPDDVPRIIDRRPDE